LLRRAGVRSFHLNGHTAPFAPLGFQGIAQVDQAEQSLQTVKAIIVTGEHPKEEVQFGQGWKGNAVGHATTSSAP
jgi:hypothetical protein